MNVAWNAINQKMEVALVEQGPMGGTCLNNGCVPSKILIYPANVIRTLENASAIGIQGHVDEIDISLIMKRMHTIVDEGRTSMEDAAKTTDNLDWYQSIGEFVDDYQIKTEHDLITAPKIVIATGSRPMIPSIPGLENAGYLDNVSLLNLKNLPKSLIIMGGGYIACEYGHFFSAMGTKVTILGRNSKLLKSEEPEISEIVEKRLSQHINVNTNHDVVKVEKDENKKIVYAVDRATREVKTFAAQEIMAAFGRQSNADLLKPENSGVETDQNGWVIVNKFLETTKPNIWALGDAIGKYMFRHTANYESNVIWKNAFSDHKEAIDYHAVPHAVFTHPQVGSVGMTEDNAKANGYHNILVGWSRYTDVAKGYAMGEEDGLVKVMVNEDNGQILGCHAVGTHASDLVQQVVYLMNAEDGSYMPIVRAQVIHPALSEVVVRAFANLMPTSEYSAIQ